MYTEIDTILQFLCFRSRSDDAGDDEQRGCLFIILGTLIVGVSAWMASREIVYLCCGKFADARVLRVYDSVSRDSRTTVDFEFADPETGNLRRHSYEMAAGWRPPTGPLKVEYVPGAETFARVAGSHQRWSLWIFGASLIAIIVYIGWLIREANSPICRKRSH